MEIIPIHTILVVKIRKFESLRFHLKLQYNSIFLASMSNKITWPYKLAMVLLALLRQHGKKKVNGTQTLQERKERTAKRRLIRNKSSDFVFDGIIFWWHLSLPEII